MSSEYLTILQLNDSCNHGQLETAYKSSRARYLRLTRLGPLRFYRKDLLVAVERAYWHLRRELQPTDGGGVDRPAAQLVTRPKSLLARQVKGAASMSMRPPVKSAVKKNIFIGDRFGDVDKPETPSNETSKMERLRQAQVEDQFCHEVIYRLEGDLIRFDARLELLRLARDAEIPLFQANLLIAQIVEAVRQNKLYLPSTTEKAMQSEKNHPGKMRRRRRLLAAIGIAVGLTLLLDILFIYLLDL